MPDRLLKIRRGAQPEATAPAQFFHQVAETLPHMVWTARADGSAEYFNSRVLEYTGRTLGQLEGWGWRSMVHPDDWQRCLARWTKAFKKGQPYEVEYRLRRRDGRYYWHLGSAMPLREGGRIVRWVGSSTDIENQKRAERLLDKAREALAALVSSRSTAQVVHDGEQERFRAFMDSMPGVAWIKDSNLRYVWVSASYERILGKSLDAIRGRDDFAVWPAAMAEQFQRNDEKVLRVKGTVQDVAHTPLPGGGMGRWTAVKFPFPDGTGAFGVAGIGFEIADHGDETGVDSAGDSPLGRLSGRELQVLHLMVEGCTSAEIGARLALSPKSVDTYRSRLMAKLRIDDLPQLVKFALRYGLTTKR
ncbi:MAG TPA: PAS domain-containing protein [Burkholderiales bacterium]|nr:PAS domain-containing protein [Burkholderiales bacterium]